MTTYSNPRMRAEITDWPLGGDRRGKAVFEVEQHPKRGERATRTTENPKTGGWNKPKTGVYAAKVRIVDGSDGRTYIASFTPMYGHINIMQGNLQFSAETFMARDPFYAAYLGSLFGVAP